MDEEVTENGQLNKNIGGSDGDGVITGSKRMRNLLSASSTDSPDRTRRRLGDGQPNVNDIPDDSFISTKENVMAILREIKIKKGSKVITTNQINTLMQYVNQLSDEHLKALTKIDKQREQLDKASDTLQNQQQSQTLYSEVAKRASSNNSNQTIPMVKKLGNSRPEHPVLVYPATRKDGNLRLEKESFQKMAKQLESSLKPQENGMCISKLKPINGEGIALITPNIETQKLVMEKLSNEKNALSINVTVPQKLNPRVIIKFVDEQYSSDEVKCALKNQNPFIPKDRIDSIKFICQLKGIDRSKMFCHWIVEVHNEIRRAIIESGNRVYIGLSSCKTEDYLKMLQCFHCCMIGHKSDKCPNKSMCTYCASVDHDSRNCTLQDKEKCNQWKCGNCLKLKTRAKTQEEKEIDVDHTSFQHKQCFYAKQRCSDYVKKVDYGNI